MMACIERCVDGTGKRISSKTPTSSTFLGDGAYGRRNGNACGRARI